VLVKLIDSPGVPGGKALALCHADGEMLDNQFNVVVETGIGECPSITVSFRIDGERIRFAD
jgi:hypothetical protein